jgi:hypothetical protein
MIGERMGEGRSVPDRHPAFVPALGELPAQRCRGGEPLRQRRRDDADGQQGGGGEGNGHERCEHRSANLGFAPSRGRLWEACGELVDESLFRWPLVLCLFQHVKFFGCRRLAHNLRVDFPSDRR